MTNGNYQTKQYENLILLQRKWKIVEKTTFIIDLVLLIIYAIFSIVFSSINFNSIAFFVLAVIFSIIMLADIVILFVSWYKLYCLKILIANLKNEDK